MDDLLALAAYELTLFAVIGFLIGGVDDFLIDCVWMLRSLWRNATVYRRYNRSNVATLPPPVTPGLIIVFIAAWDESSVIGRMVDHAVRTFDHPEYRIYVGCYPNDPATTAAVRAVCSEHVHVVVNDVGIM